MLLYLMLRIQSNCRLLRLLACFDRNSRAFRSNSLAVLHLQNFLHGWYISLSS